MYNTAHADLHVLDADVSRISNYMRSSSPEYDEVVLTDHSDDDNEYSEEIPVKMEYLKSTNEDLLNKNTGDVLFDDSESDEFSLPQVDWACVNSQSPEEIQLTTDGAPPSGRVDGPCLAAEPCITNHCLFTNSAMTVNESDHNYMEVCEGDTTISEGLTFNIVSDSPMAEETTFLHEGNYTAEETTPQCTSRLSRKRSRVSRIESEERVQCKRLCHDVDDMPTASGSVAEALLPTLPQVDAGSDVGGFMPSYESSSDSNIVSQPSSSVKEETVISMFSQDCDTSFSQGRPT